ncbi:MAG: M16 family metallopeptidase [Sandaracinaceae bacterium]
MRPPLHLLVAALALTALGSTISAASAQVSARELDAPSGASPAPLHYRLENGLEVILQPIEGRAFTAVAVTYHVGSADQPAGYRGLAHLTEHLMFSGTDELGDGEPHAYLDSLGAVTHNATTHADDTVYYESVPSSQLERTLWLEAHRMARLLSGLSAARVERQRRVVLHEGVQNGHYGWRGRAREITDALVYGPTHPYAMIQERAEDVSAIELPHVQWFFQTYYAPDNATLALVGGFDPDEARGLVERMFGPIRRSARAPSRARERPRPIEGEALVRMEVQSTRDFVSVIWQTPPWGADGDAALDILSSVLVQGDDAPLRVALVDSGLALGVDALQSSRELASEFRITAVAAPEHSPAELAAAIDAALAGVRGFSEVAIDDARAAWARRDENAQEGIVWRASILGIRGADGYLGTIENERARYASVNSPSIIEAMRRYLPRDRRVVFLGHANPMADAPGRVLETRWIR